MKWYEVSNDLGDGTTAKVRFRTREEAQAWCDKMETKDWWIQDGDGSPVTEVDTDSKYFFHDPADDDDDDLDGSV